MKLFCKSKNGKMIKVGDGTFEEAHWYFMTVEVMAKIDTFANMDEVTIQTKTEGANKFVTDIVKGASAPVAQKTVATPAVKPVISTGAKPDIGVVAQTSGSGYLSKEDWIAKKKAEGTWTESKTADKGTDTNNSIKRQAIAHATSRTIVGMQGTVTPDNVIEVMEKIYKKYVELVG